MERKKNNNKANILCVRPAIVDIERHRLNVFRTCVNGPGLIIHILTIVLLLELIDCTELGPN